MSSSAESRIPADLIQRFSDRQEQHLHDLCQWLRIGSVSSDPTAADAMQQAAVWLEDKFRSAGLATRRIATKGFDLVYAETPPVPGRRWCWSTGITMSSHRSR